MVEPASHQVYDAIVIGSGFGGSLLASELVRAGQTVLMLERGDWVPRGPENWDPHGTVELTPFYSTEVSYRLRDDPRRVLGSYSCVGGPSVFYGGVSLRMREADFEPGTEIVGASGAEWPFSYADLEPYYARAERILGVAGETGRDPTEPYRSSPYPQPPAPLSETSRLIEKAARSLSLSPFRLPLAINYAANDGRPACTARLTCDTFACAIGAKNDLATVVLPRLIREGLVLKHNTVAVRLVRRDDRVVAVECFEKATGSTVLYRARLFILAAGALGSPHLVLASDLERVSPAGDFIGRYLVRHCNAIILGVFPRLPDNTWRFHKELGFHDFYFGHPSISHPRGKLGAIQQLPTPPLGLIRARLGAALGRLVKPAVDHATGLLVLAEDQPRYENHVAVDRGRVDRSGLPELLIAHRYSERDLEARRVLLGKAREILGRAGAWFFYVHDVDTFSHASGTIRMGIDPRTSPLDPHCRFRGVENLYVVDASFMPTPGGVNPSLTIAANALRVGERLARTPASAP